MGCIKVFVDMIRKDQNRNHHLKKGTSVRGVVIFSPVPLRLPSTINPTSFIKAV